MKRRTPMTQSTQIPRFSPYCFPHPGLCCDFARCSCDPRLLGVCSLILDRTAGIIAGREEERGSETFTWRFAIDKVSPPSETLSHDHEAPCSSPCLRPLVASVNSESLVLEPELPLIMGNNTTLRINQCTTRTWVTSNQTAQEHKRAKHNFDWMKDECQIDCRVAMLHGCLTLLTFFSQAICDTHREEKRRHA